MIDPEMLEPALDIALDRAMEMGWEFFDAPGKADANELKRINESAHRTAETAAALYAASPEFRQILEWMLDVTVRRAAWIARLGLPMDQAYAYGCFREGQNAMTAAVLKLIATGIKGKAPRARDT
jgi:hypothetical protein